MESTGVYWIPVWNVLEAVRFRFELLLVNPATVRALRGAKTDRIDAARIAEFLQHGLLRGSFVPPRPIHELRDLTRMRVQLQRDRNRIINRIGRLLETVNIKLSSVASNIVGKSGRAMLEAMVQGGSRPETLAELALGTLKGKKTELALALDGRFTEHFRWLLGRLLQDLARWDEELVELDRRLDEQMHEHADLIKRLRTIPGVKRVTACALIAELGVEMTQFPAAAQAASWAGLCPGNSESAGKRKSGATRKGSRYLRRILVQSAWAVKRKKNCFLTGLFFRLAQRRGLKKAAVAVAHRILIAAYYVIRDGVEYREVGSDYFDRLHPERTLKRLTRRLEQIGYQVQVRPAAQPDAEPALPGLRGPGRPCHCAARGIPCTHSTRVQAATPVALPDPPRCSKCARWRIPCIHVRYSQPLPSNPVSPPESTT